jgi:hypothetical protein
MLQGFYKSGAPRRGFTSVPCFSVTSHSLPWRGFTSVPEGLKWKVRADGVSLFVISFSIAAELRGIIPTEIKRRHLY